MQDANHGNALFLLLLDKTDNDGPVGGIKRSRRFIEQENRIMGDETARY